MAGESTPRFAELLDWAEGRLEEPRRSEIAALVRTDAAAARSVAWIFSFHEAARLMPLTTPPESTRAALRALVDERVTPWRPTTYSVGALALDAGSVAAQGTRAGDQETTAGHGTGPQADARDLVFETDLGPVRVLVAPGPAADAESGPRDTVRLTAEQSLPAGARLVLTAGERVRASGRQVGRTELEALAVPRDVDQVWLVHATGQVRLDLPPA